MTGELPYGATPLDEEETEGLLLAHVSTRGELDELEEANIQVGLEWARGRALRAGGAVDVLTEDFLYELHRKMFDAVWDWAGEVRRTGTNIGVDTTAIRSEVRKLIDDARYWRDTGVHEADELAVRFHHRLVAIHPFPNGNGRHARMMADLIALQAGRPPFSWGGRSLTETSELRRAYIAALRAADDGDLEPLIAFSRT